MSASFSPSNTLPLIATKENANGSAVILISENTGGVIQSISVQNTADWLTFEVIGNTVNIQTAFADSPFPYRVHSVDSTPNSYTVDSIENVPCDQYVYHYERLTSGILSHEITIVCQGLEVDGVRPVRVPFSTSYRYIIEIYADYSIGKNALEELIKCQQ